MNDIKVYDFERECGLEEKIRSQASVAFTSPVVKDFDKVKGMDLAKASEDLLEITSAAVDDPDLYNVYSILVSTSWNRNDDIFDKEEVWAARNSPVFKPTNLEHDEKQMVGNIIKSWPVDENFELIDDNIDPSALPDFHLLVSSVIFKQWQDPDLRDRAQKLIAEIEEGDKFVSMECIFRGFDYGVVDPDGSSHVVARSEETSFLTQHLRAYGGRGVYQDHKVGRVLRNITFSGKGFVARPANPESIIFDKDHIFSFASAKRTKNLFFESNGVTNNTEKQLYFEVKASDMEKHKMSDNQFLNDQVSELKEALASVQAENKTLNEKLAEANVSAFEKKITELEATVAEFESKSAEISSQLEESVAKSEALQTELTEKSEALETIQADMHKMKEDKKKKDRKDMMVEAGLSEEEAEAKIEVFSELSDDAFAAIVETISTAMYKEKAKKEKEEKEKASEEAGAGMPPELKEAIEKKKEKEAKAEEEVEETEASELVEAETDESSVAFSSEEDELSTARASLQEWVEKNILKK